MYKLYKTLDGNTGITKQNDDGSTISFLINPENSDYQAYLKWIEEGNTPEEAE